MAITSDPTYPIPGEVVSLAITSATGSTAATRFEITSVPENSDLDAGMLVDAAGDPTQEFTPDVAGAYAFTAYDYRRFTGGAAYAGDPAGEARDLLVATQTGTIYVGDVLDLPIRGAGHEVKLRLTVVNGTVREAELVEPTTEVARCATLDTTVLAAVGELVDVAAASIGESLVSDVAAFVTAFNAHLGSLEAHPLPGPDTVNPLVAAEIGTVVGAIRRLGDLRDHYVLHLVTDDVWHEDTIDLEHLPIVAKATDLAGAYVLLAEMRRVYPAHINDSDIHPELEAAADLTANSLLTTAVIAVLDYFASETPTPPAGENPGMLSLASKHGFAQAFLS
jgi:hypothetical protein